MVLVMRSKKSVKRQKFQMIFNQIEGCKNKGILCVGGGGRNGNIS
jgi:hypothetical protein